MISSNNRALYYGTFLIIILSIIITATGVFYKTGGTPYKVLNQYGDEVLIYGDGLYAHDSHFRAPIFRGSDFTILFIVVPLLIMALVNDIKKQTIKQRIYLTSLLGVLTYYATSIAFGVTYNSLHLLYIALFSTTFFSLIMALISIDYQELENVIDQSLLHTSIYTFLILTSVALFVAWLPDITSALLAKRSLSLIEVYTTEITYVLDMGLISPLALITLFLLKKKKGLGYVLLAMLLTLCLVIGVMLPLQTIFQIAAGISVPIPVLITKVGSFVLMAFWALYLNFRLLQAIKIPITKRPTLD